MSESNDSDRERIEEIANEIADARCVFAVYELPNGDLWSASHIADGEYETTREAAETGIDVYRVARKEVEAKFEEWGGFLNE